METKAAYAFYERWLTVSAQDGAHVLCRLVFAGARTSSLSGDLGAPWRDESPALEFYDESEEGARGEPGLFLDSCATQAGAPWWGARGGLVKGGKDLSPEVREQVAIWAQEQTAAYPRLLLAYAPARRRRLSVLAEGHVRPLLKRRATFAR